VKGTTDIPLQGGGTMLPTTNGRPRVRSTLRCVWVPFHMGANAPAAGGMDREHTNESQIKGRSDSVFGRTGMLDPGRMTI
jgi:hypothetical protein